MGKVSFMSSAAPTDPAATAASPHAWDAALYQGKHAFVYKHGASLLDLLDARPGERVLDLGCGTGQLTAEIARRGATVVGIDKSPAMIEQARVNFSALRFEVADATRFTADEPFDAVFSNAALHWVKPPEEAAARMREALKPGGRLVAELGGRGNVAAVLAAAHAAADSIGVASEGLVEANYFPTVGEYASLLERQGFEVGTAALFDRPTPLEGEGGLRDWLRMFRGSFLDAVPAPRHEEFFRAAEAFARPTLYRDGVWSADYRRLRITARRLP